MKKILICLLFFVANTFANNSETCHTILSKRSYDGYCNNIDHPEYGQAHSLMSRLALTDTTRSNANEFNQRFLSNSFFATSIQKEDPLVTTSERIDGLLPEDKGLNMFAVIFLQFVSHDLGLIPLTSFLEPDQTISFNMTILQCETFDDAGIYDELCAIADTRFGTILENKLVTRQSLGQIDNEGILTPFNNVSAYLDLNTVYGNNENTAHQLRTHQGGKLKTNADSQNLPINLQEPGFFTTNECDLFGPTTTTHAAGDPRVDENLFITVLHTLFLREHNRLAKKIVQDDVANNMSDEEIFQQARQQNIAQYQHLIFDEVLPIVFGEKAFDRYVGKYKHYKSQLKVATSVEFDIVAFRLHSLLNLPLLMLNESCQPLLSRTQVFTRPDKIQERGTCEAVRFREIGVDNVLRGMLIQKAQQFDTKMTDGIRNIRIGATGNVDVAAVDLFRERLHALPKFNELRKTVGFKSLYQNQNNIYNDDDDDDDECITDGEQDSIECFLKITNNCTLAAQLQQIYKKIDQIDAFVGVNAERFAFAKKSTSKRSSVGKTATKIILDHFKLVRDGDRFWYENILDRKQVRHIKHLSLDEIVVRNFDSFNQYHLHDILFHQKQICPDL